MRVTYVGHATVLIELDGVKLLTDPVLSGRVIHLRRHSAPPDPAALAGIDAVILSHLHTDHVHRRSLAMIDSEVPVFAPPGSERLLTRFGRARVTELAAGDTATVGSLTLRATPAAHGGRRPPLGPTAGAIGFEVSGSHRLYFAGDTDLFPEMAAIAGTEASPLQLALLPIWGWGLSPGSGHLHPATAAEAAAILKPRIAVPIHWGTLFPIGLGRMAPARLGRPALNFAAATRRLAPEVEVEVLQPGGEPLLIGSSTSPASS